MEEDSSAKAAPVTRLRRRLSVEPEDSPLPTTPSTPSKKRSTRLVAKPQLELIDEVASENVPKRTTRKTTVKEIESETTGTPTPITPSRRSTRVRSNTSLLSETIAQSVESPRAKRALRRNSQLGSDSESAAPITPARQTRRTRKGSTTSVDKQAPAPEENITVLTITSTETTTKEETQKDPNTNKDKAGSPLIRKSPRLKLKSGNTDETDIIHIKTAVHSTQDKNPDVLITPAKGDQKSGNTDETDNIHIEIAVHSTQDKNPVVSITPAKGDQTENNTSIHTASPKENKTAIEMLSTSSINLIKDIKTSDIKTTSLNKSTTSIDKSINDLKNKRNRTKSWTTLTASSLNVGLTDDKEDSREKLLERYRSISGSGDGIQNSGNSSKLEELEIKSPNETINKSKISLLNISTENKENIVVSEKPVEPPKTDTMKLFESSPMNQKPMVIIEDSDSGSYDKLVMDVQIEGEDQCVPVGKSAHQTRNESLEPMDIDETMPENVTIDDFSDKSNASKDEIEVPEKRKSLISEKSLLNDKSMNKSKRKSSISKQASDTPPRISSCEDDKNKSTPKQLLDNTQNSSENTIENNKSRKNSFRDEKIDRSKTDLDTSQNESFKLTANSPRKSSILIEDEKVINQNVNDSKINQNKDESSNSFNKSTRKSTSSEDKIEKLDESIKKSKKSVSMSQNYCETDQVENSLNKSRRKSSTSIVDDNLDKLYESCNIVSGCQNKSEIKPTEEANNQSINKSQRKTSLSSLSKDNLNDITNKSKRKSSNSETNSNVEENKSSKKANKSKRTSSSQAESPMLEKSGNENKSTLVISQVIDDINNVTSQNLTNELSKSVSGPEVKNKAIDKINLSPKNYLTSTPIQQKSLQKMSMQINTSIISPALEIKNVTVEKTPKLNGIEEEINFKNKKKLPRALSSPSSSDEEIERKSVNKLGIKKSPKIKPALDTSESETKTESPRKNINKKLPRRVRALDSSSDEQSDIVENQQKIRKIQNNESKVDAKKVKTPNKNTPIVSNSSDSEESEKEVSKDKNKMFDDEASEASDDYESGDSRSDDERQYENDHEILEKGETLDSEEELSNDSDYEKDSFIVSSDAEDNEMLSGTGDDLCTSDNELTMSAKSKKKFNERKLKQQKKASREMYEARHKNDSAASPKADTSKSKKSKRQRLESSTLESENDSLQTKKNNRLRIDSSHDSANSADESIRIKKKKSKRLSESICETTTNEKEISLFNQTTEKNDPLTTAIKLEPKTPQKGFNISTVAINDNIEQVQVDSNASIMKHSDTLDPLQATMAVDDEDVEDSLSEDNEIIENYDSVLNNLTLQTNKLKTHNTSLNLNKKVKNAKNPVIDQLNLTQTKKSEKNKNDKNQQAEPVKSITKENVGREEEDSSDSIDMKLLFPEDSTDSEANASKFKPEVNKQSEADTIIPLKRTEAKTNLLDKTDMNISLNESSLNGSKKKNKKRKTSQSSQPEESIILDNGIKVIVDTIGIQYEDIGLSQDPINSSKKKNKKNKSLNESAAFEMAADIDCTDGFTLTEVETSITSEKKKKKNKNKNFDESMKTETSINVSGSHSEKKPKKKSQSTSDFIESAEPQEETMTEEILVNTSIKSEKKKKNKDTSVVAEPDVVIQSAKKKSKKISISEENKSQAEETMTEEKLVNTSIKSDKKKKNKDTSVVAEPDVEETQSSKKKSKKISISEENKSQAIHEETIIEEIPVNTSIKSEKKKKNKDASVIAEPDVEETQSAKKKSKKISISEENKSQAIHEETIIEEIPVNTSIKSEKKKKNKGASVIAETDVEETQSAKKKSKISISEENKSQGIHDESDDDDAPEEVSYKSAKKSDVTDTVTDEAVTTSTEKKFKKNKKKKNKNIVQPDEKLDEANAHTEQENSELRKRKRKVSNNPTKADDTAKPTRNEKKKRKVNLDDDYAAAYDNNAQRNEDDTSAKKSKKDKSKKHIKEDIPQNNAKKRKNRENDNSVEKISKVSKKDSFDEIHVPRLPETILQELSEKPTKTKKISATAISTMPFLVQEGGRKNKPSEYLEQSVCLNNSPVKKKKHVKHTNPKVLPFTPTAVTSDSGCTNRFNISLLPKDTQFVAQASNVENFKAAFLGTQRIKKMGTLERCKTERSRKLSKF